MKKGDTISDIANRFGVTQEELIEANPWLSDKYFLNALRVLATFPDNPLKMQILIRDIILKSFLDLYQVKQDSTNVRFRNKFGMTIEIKLFRHPKLGSGSNYKMLK